jgi:hypothetical protein
MAELNFKRLKEAVDWSIRQMDEPRKHRIDSIKRLVGKHYFRGGSDHVQPVNMIELATSVYIRHLAARAPKVMVATSVDHLKPHAYTMQLALNQIPGEIGLARTLRRAVLEAMFGMGVVKVGLCASGRDIEGIDPGDAFVDVIPFGKYFIDMSADDMGSVQFEGNDYWTTLEYAQSIQDRGKKLVADDHTVTGPDGQELAVGIQVSEGADLYMDKVQLRDVWLPESQELVTYSITSGELIRKVTWDGPQKGPYHRLSFSDVPGNLLPLPPVALWRDLHDLGNNLFRKLGKQGVDKKQVVAFAGGNDKSVEALKAAADGEGIRYSGQKPENIVVGGVDAETLALYLQTRDQFNYYAGNLDSLGGLGASSETVGQEELIGQAAGARMSHMKSVTVDFDRGIWDALAWYEWTDPIRERTVEKRVEGFDIAIRTKWSPETRDGDWLDYNFDIDPYSMEDETPALKLQKLGRALNEFVFPMLPIMQQQGIQFDFREYTAMIARLANLDEMRKLFTFQEPIPSAPEQSGDQATPSFKPTETTRNYVRHNKPGATRAGKDDVMSRILMGGGVQQSEAASLGRPSS